MAKKALDTNLIVYSLIEGHPASDVCDRLIRDKRYTFYTTALTPFEAYFVLRRIYGINAEAASRKMLSLLEAPITLVNVQSRDVRSALERCADKDLEVNDSLLIQMCLNIDIPSLASDDRKLLEACEEEGIHSQSPLNDVHRQLMRDWERQRLPPAGLPRLLKRVHAWLLQADHETARKFLEATGNLRHLP